MEVTAANFNSIFPNIENAINNCTFMSIDCELTGLNITRNINAYDKPEDYYEKIRKSCREFLVIQYGLGIFRYDPEEDSFKQQGYNFYVFRRPVNRNIPDLRFLCQSSSINFLINQNFDFNKLFKHGISYLNDEESEIYKNSLTEAFIRRTELKQSQLNGDISPIPIPDNARSFIDDVVQQINEFLENNESEMELPKCSAFFRRLIYQTKSERFSDKISLETRQIDNERILFARRLKNGEEEAEIEKKNYEERLKELEHFTGFTKVLKLIVASGKLMIGHNLCLDFLHTIDKFLTPLPKDYEDFKDMAHHLFSKILDTKYMSSMEPFRDLIPCNVLKNLLDTVSEKPFELPKIEIEDGCQGYQLSDKKEHEAGYDAYITGLSFLAMWRYLGKKKNMEDNAIFENFKLLEPFMNRIFLMTLVNNQCINLVGEDPNLSRDHVFYLSFPKDWKLRNITSLFSPFGNVHVSWIDESSAYVGLHKKEQAAMALSTLSKGDTYSIMTFAKRRALLAGITTPLPSPVAYKKRKSSEGQPPSKKRRTSSLNSSGIYPSKRSIEPIEEEQVEPEDSRVAKKTFSENDSWE